MTLDRVAVLDHLGEIEYQLEAGRRQHYYCEDCWYSCPLAVEPGETEPGSGCCNGDKPMVCDCGADAFNARLDGLLAALRGENRA